MTYVALMMALLEGRGGVGGWVLIAVILVTLIALAYGLFTPSGSGISLYPWGRRRASDSQPGAQGPGEPSGKDEGEHAPFDHGTR